MTVQALAAAVDPPHDVGIRSDWMSVTDRLGVSYAPDYRAVVEAYGFGYFEPGTMLSDPRSDRFRLSVDAVLRVMRDPDLRRHPLPLPPYPGPGSRLLPVTSSGYIMAVVVDGTRTTEHRRRATCRPQHRNATAVRSRQQTGHEGGQMARKTAIEVVPTGARWARHKVGLQPAAAFHRSEQEAILVARADAKRAGTALVVKGPDGRVRQLSSFRGRSGR